MASAPMDAESSGLALELTDLASDDEPSINDGDLEHPSNFDSPLALLPIELLQDILSYLSAEDLTRVSATCRSLTAHAKNDLLWLNIVNSYLPDPIHDTGPFESFRSLYIAHHPCWFIPQKKIWFSDTEHTGNLILARYDHRRGVIEAYRVIAERRKHQVQFWEHNPEVIIQSFDPKVSLWLDDPVLLLKSPHSGRRYLKGDRMPLPLETQHVYNALTLCSTETHPELPPDEQWPPPKIPSDHHVPRDLEDHRSDEFPDRLDMMSEHAFRIRRWAHFRIGMPIFSTGRSDPLLTYATLDPSLYIPTREKPYQGIWVGDYSAHGCEFLLFLQREPQYEAHDVAECHEPEQNDDGLIQRGSIEAIKLTGDPNVPRGETSFVADDIGPRGLIRIADEALFQGARIVRSRGHVAGLGFRDDTFISSQLILMSTDCIAHYWDPMGHISYFRRLDIDSLLQI
ncbi:hypothetical protein FE257_010943 [Aspergillus nanangensis]|uniref:F-box domain-containing protein n=1 Tax=Aspergillus nanangensis TaxID=2582783 RepID=A0AAD4CW53_ASPNN|nr:hypothetical protein FE257_010943 [Aspergillus nanangensis]